MLRLRVELVIFLDSDTGHSSDIQNDKKHDIPPSELRNLFIAKVELWHANRFISPVACLSVIRQAERKEKI